MPRVRERARTGTDDREPRPVPKKDAEIIRLLVSIVGREAALRLIRELGGSRLRFPTLGAVRRLQRNRRIVAALEEPEATYAKVARRWGLSARTVIRIAKDEVTRI
jgi:Mor family transcriptional regulator